VVAPFPHPAAYFSPWRSDHQAAVELGVVAPDLDAALDEAESVPLLPDDSDADGGAAWRRAAALWSGRAYSVPLLRLQSNFLCRPHVSGLCLRPDGLFRLADLRLGPTDRPLQTTSTTHAIQGRP